ncbi:uncharacterized protein G2W53_003651 [Senna tora]|uniref:Uncharacterized protein n=1 Tax=Senna tora TaxID=362788 RepID=A0A834XBL3_9FABA|nr:uncharacterized protein G2W53_003651 [Senna tora]
MEMCVNRDEGEAHVWVLDYWVARVRIAEGFINT